MSKVSHAANRYCFRNVFDDWGGDDNPVRAVDAFVEELNPKALGLAGAEPAATGPPAYHPGTLLKIYIYGYLNRIQSSRNQLVPMAKQRYILGKRGLEADPGRPIHRPYINSLSDPRKFKELQQQL